LFWIARSDDRLMIQVTCSRLFYVKIDVKSTQRIILTKTPVLHIY